MFKNFEEIHPSKKAAFVDGALCAAIITYFVTKWRNEFRPEGAYTQGYVDAMNEATKIVQDTIPLDKQ